MITLFSRRSISVSQFRAAAGITAACAGLAMSAASVLASSPTDAPNSYSSSHKFKIETSGNAPPVVKLVYKCETYARTKSCTDRDKDKNEVIIGTGVTNKQVTSVAPSSTATAEAEADISDLKPGCVAGKVTAKGKAQASVAGCGTPVGSGYAEASSSAKIKARGTKVDKKGRISWSGGWKHEKGVSGRATQYVSKDPIVARLYDLTTGEVSEWTLLSIKSTLSGGSTSWDNGVLSSNAMNMTFEASVGAPVIQQAGTIRIRVVNGIVTDSVQTGIFAGLGLPPVGSVTGFAVPLGEIALDFNLGGDDSHDLEPEFELDNAGHDDDDANADAQAVLDASTLINDLAIGFELSNISTPAVGDATLGYVTQAGLFHVAEDLVAKPDPSGMPAQLDMIEWPVYQTGAPIGMPLQAAFVRVWKGNPADGGTLVAGDLTANRLMPWLEPTPEVFRVSAEFPDDPARPVHYAAIDMSWVPPLEPEQQYYIEVAAMGQPGFKTAFTPPSPYENPDHDNALQFNVQAKQWQKLQDQASGRLMSIPMRVHFVSQDVSPACTADCDGNGTLTVDDFICFQTVFALSEPQADCDGDGVLTIDDFICYLTQFAIGC